MTRGPVTYGSAPIYGQLVPVGEPYMFAPGLAVGPTLRGIGSSPALTIPQGIGGGASSMETANPMASATAGGPISRKMAAILAGSFIVGYLILHKVHWRA